MPTNAEVDAFLFLLRGSPGDDVDNPADVVNLSSFLSEADVAKTIIALHTMARSRELLCFAGTRQEAAAVVSAYQIIIDPLLEADLILKLARSRLLTALKKSVEKSVDDFGVEFTRDVMRSSNQQTFRRRAFVLSLFSEASDSAADDRFSFGDESIGFGVAFAPIAATLSACNHCLLQVVRELGVDNLAATTIDNVAAWSIRRIEGGPPGSTELLSSHPFDIQYLTSRSKSQSDTTATNWNAYGEWLSIGQRAEDKMCADTPIFNPDFLAMRVSLHRHRWLHPSTLGLSTPAAALTSVASGLHEQQVILLNRSREAVPSLSPTPAQLAITPSGGDDAVVAEESDSLHVVSHRNRTADPSWAIANRSAAFHSQKKTMIRRKIQVASDDDDENEPSRERSRSQTLPAPPAEDDVFDFICSRPAFFASAAELAQYEQQRAKAASAYDSNSPQSRWNVTVSALCNFFSVLCLSKLSSDPRELAAQLSSLSPTSPNDDHQAAFSCGLMNVSIRRLVDYEFMKTVCSPILSSSSRGGNDEMTRSSFRLLFNEDDLFAQQDSKSSHVSSTYVLAGGSRNAAGEVMQQQRLRSFAAPLLKDQTNVAVLHCQQFRLGLSASQLVAVATAWKMLEALHSESVVLRVVQAVHRQLSSRPREASAVGKLCSHHMLMLTTVKPIAGSSSGDVGSDEDSSGANGDTNNNNMVDRDESPFHRPLRRHRRRPTSVEKCSFLSALSGSESALVRVPDITAVTVEYFLPRDVLDGVHVQSVERAAQFVSHAGSLLPRTTVPSAETVASAQFQKTLLRIDKGSQSPASRKVRSDGEQKRNVRLSEESVRMVIDRYAFLSRETLHTAIGGMVVQTALRAPPIIAMYRQVSVRANSSATSANGGAAPAANAAAAIAAAGHQPRSGSASLLPPALLTNEMAVFLPLATPAPKKLDIITATSLEPQPVAPSSIYLSPSLCNVIRRAWRLSQYVQKELAPSLLETAQEVEQTFLTYRDECYKHAHDVTKMSEFVDRDRFERRRELLRTIHQNTAALSEVVANRIGLGIPDFDELAKSLAAVSLLDQPVNKQHASSVADLHETQLKLQALKRQRTESLETLASLRTVIETTAKAREETLAIRKGLIECLERKKVVFRREVMEAHTALQLEIDTFAAALEHQLRLEKVKDAHVGEQLAVTLEHSIDVAKKRISEKYEARLQQLHREHSRLEALAVKVRNAKLLDDLSLIGKWGGTAATRSTLLLGRGSSSSQSGRSVGRFVPLGVVRVRGSAHARVMTVEEYSDAWQLLDSTSSLVESPSANDNLMVLLSEGMVLGRSIGAGKVEVKFS